MRNNETMAMNVYCLTVWSWSDKSTKQNKIFWSRMSKINCHFQPGTLPVENKSFVVCCNVERFAKCGHLKLEQIYTCRSYRRVGWQGQITFQRIFDRADTGICPSHSKRKIDNQVLSPIIHLMNTVNRNIIPNFQFRFVKCVQARILTNNETKRKLVEM